MEEMEAKRALSHSKEVVEFAASALCGRGKKKKKGEKYMKEVVHKLYFLVAIWSFVLINAIFAILALHFTCILASFSSLNAAIVLLLYPHGLLLFGERAYLHHLLLKAVTVPADCPDSNSIFCHLPLRDTKLFLH